MFSVGDLLYFLMMCEFVVGFVPLECPVQAFIYTGVALLQFLSAILYALVSVFMRCLLVKWSDLTTIRM